MSATSEDKLLAFLDDICQGHRSLQDCIAEAPDLRDDLLALSPLLDLATDYSASAPIDDDTRLRLRSQLRAAITSNGHNPEASKDVLRELGHKPWLTGVFAWPLDRLSTIGQLAVGHAAWLPAITAGVGAAVAGGAVVYAAQTAGPESPLYPVRQVVQTVSETFVPASSPVATPQPTATLQATSTATPGIVTAAGRSAILRTDEGRERERDTGLGRSALASAAPKPGSEAQGRGLGAGGEQREPTSPGAVVQGATHASGDRGRSPSPSASPSSGSPSASSGDGGRGPGSPSPSASSRDGGSTSPSPSPSIVASTILRSSSSPSPSPSGSSGSGSSRWIRLVRWIWFQLRCLGLQLIWQF